MKINSFLEVWTLLNHVANRIVNDTQNGTDSVNYFPVVDTGPLPKNCSEPPFQLIGPEHTSCGLLEPLFYYNITEGTCLQHHRTGCLRSANSFFSLEECEMTCMNPVFTEEDEDSLDIELISDNNNNTVVKIKKVVKKPSNKEKKVIDNNIIATPTSDTVLAPEECMLPFEMGPCTNYSVRFGLQFGSNARDSMCKPFVYGGCGGNGNNFETLEECLQICKWSPMSFVDSKNEDDDDEGTHDCLGNPFDVEDQGTCTDPLTVYFYNHTEGECQLMNQPVCHRTLNNFDSLQECETICRYYIAQERGTCTIRPQTGSCRTFFKRYYYDSTDGICKQFVYGGCHGNSNRFRNLQECQKICGSPIEEENAVDHQLAVQGDLYYRSPLGVPLPAIKVIKMKNRDCSASPIHPLDLKWGVTFCGYQQIFFYNTSLNECQRLMLRQCRKTDNSFRSLAECKSKCVDQFAERPGRSHRQNTENEIAPKGPNFVSSCEEIMCPWHLWSHYTDRGCEPVYDDGSCCPLHFTCPLISTEGPSRFMECVHKGRRYPVGSFVNVSNPCDICFCSSGPDGAKIQCVEVACPEDYSPARPGCVYVSEPGRCCRTLKCGTINMSVGQVIQLDSSISCQLDNKTFSEGEDIIFEGNPCHKCICSPNFAGAYGPGCSDINCHLDLEFEFESRGCVPVYREDVCCPVDWHCPPYSDHSRQTVDSCLLPREKGNCKGRFVRYHYEAERGKCYKFIYSGCGGNDNNFLSRQECERQCSRDICALPPSKGSCANSAKLRYYYSPSQEKCLNFVFRCFGNANNFEDQEECEATCGLQKSLTDAERCGLLVEPGPCNSPRIRYYFNPISEKCEEFIYGGCRGNENNYKTLEECQETCTPITEENKIQEAEEAMCSFAGVDYSLGHVMKTTDPCISCTCVTPPQFTCIKEECHAPNANDYIFCLKRISPEFCCTEYKCAKNIDEVCELIEGQPCDAKLDCFLIGDNCLDGGCTLGCRRKYSTRKRPS